MKIGRAKGNVRVITDEARLRKLQARIHEEGL